MPSNSFSTRADPPGQAERYGTKLSESKRGCRMQERRYLSINCIAPLRGLCNRQFLRRKMKLGYLFLVGLENASFYKDNGDSHLSRLANNFLVVNSPLHRAFL